MGKLDTNLPENKAAIERLAYEYGLPVQDIIASFSDLDEAGKAIAHKVEPVKVEDAVKEYCASNLSFAFGDLSQSEILAAFSEQNNKAICFGDGGIGGIDGSPAGINILGGAAPSGTTDVPEATVGGDVNPTDMEDGKPKGQAKKDEAKEEKTEAKSEKKAEAEADKKSETSAGTEDAKAKLKAISEDTEADKSTQKKAQDLLAQIEEANNAISKVLKESGEFASKNAPKAKESNETAPETAPTTPAA